MGEENNTKLVRMLMVFIVFSGFTAVLGNKYVKLRDAYKKAEQEKVFYCKEYHKLKNK